MKKSVIFLLTCIVLLSICVSIYAAEEITINLWARRQDNPVLAKQREDAIKEFERENPNVRVNYSALSFTDLLAKLTIATKAGNPPDVAHVPLELVQFVTGGYLRALNEFIDPADWIDFTKPSREYSTWDGQIYSLPAENSVRLLFYNKALFAEAGLASPPNTWEEFVLYAQELTDPDSGTYGYAFDGTGQMTYNQLFSFIAQAGGSVLNEDWTKCVVNEAPAVSALQLWTDLLYKYKVVPPTVAAHDWNQNVALFAAGKIGMLDGMSNFELTIRNINPDIELGLAVMPKDVKRASFGASWNFMMFKTCQHPVEAYKLMHKLTSTEVQSNWQGYLPTRVSAMTNVPKVIQDALEYSQAFEAPPILGQMIEAVSNAVSKSLSEEKSPQEALDEAAKIIDDTLAKN